MTHMGGIQAVNDCHQVSTRLAAYGRKQPILWDTPTWIYVNVGTCLLVALTITIPTLFIKKIDPKDAINYKN